MIEQRLHIGRYGWDVCVFYDATPHYSSVVMRELWRCGIPAEKYWEAERLLSTGNKNEGLTFTNFKDRISIMVIGRTSSVAQFCNTLTHEVDHLADHISKAEGIPLASEENARMHGDIIGQLLEEAARDVGGRFVRAFRYFLLNN